MTTLIIIKSENGSIFGSYTEQDWSGNGYRNDPKSLIFIFGSGSAFQIDHNSNQNRESLSSLGITSCNYKQPYYADNSIEAK